MYSRNASDTCIQGEIYAELSHINPGSAALLVMDYQVDTLTRFMTAAQTANSIACVPDRLCHVKLFASR